MGPTAKSSPARTADVGEGPASEWRQRAIERSTLPARLRAEKRMQSFLSAARELMAEKGSIDFTVQEVVDRANQSLRSFYQFFGSKHELLLLLFDEEIETTVRRIRGEAPDGDPLERLRAAVLILYEQTSVHRGALQPLFFEFAQRLMVTHAEEVARAWAPLYEHVTSIVADAAEAGVLRPGRPRRFAMMVMQTATATAERSLAGVATSAPPLPGEEVWEFCLHAIASLDVLAARAERREVAAPLGAARADDQGGDMRLP
jgi:AcrR family transcriptional regulator